MPRADEGSKFSFATSQLYNFTYLKSPGLTLSIKMGKAMDPKCSPIIANLVPTLYFKTHHNIEWREMSVVERL